MSGSKQGETKAKAETPPMGRIAELIAAVESMPGPAPVHLWNPPDCGPIDMRIDRDGAWFHEGEPIRRDALVRLFARILRRETDGGYVLVTPVEKFTIAVEDVPFLAVELIIDPAAAGARLLFRTNLDEIVVLDADHPLRAQSLGGGPFVPYVTVRPGLEARLTRSVVHDLVQCAVVEDGWLGVRSGDRFFAIGRAEEAMDA